MKKVLWLLPVILVLAVLGVIYFKNLNDNQPTIIPSRESRIPANAIKVTQQKDAAPPKSFSSDYEDPVPVPGKVNTAGAEDSAFVTPDGETLYFFFVPDVNQPVEKQVQDITVGIYCSKLVNEAWGNPERVILQDKGKLAMDGAEFVQGNVMYFCSVREGYDGIHWFKAEYLDGKWRNWVNVDRLLKLEEYKTGELHISPDGKTLYFHSDRAGGKGGLDIWASERVNGEWSEPKNLNSVNTERNEGWPSLNPQGNELWISRDYALWRSRYVNGEWEEPQKMFSPLCGESTIDSDGNVYFTHHFYDVDKMIEADIYVAHRKR